ncbi:MAG: CHAD domain-containing protein [Opitutaceae bacterium]
MAYRWKRKESVRKAVRRLGRERIEHALACLERCEEADAIHCARKDIKKVRAELRLVRARIAKKEYHRLKMILRKAAANLAAPRDAFVKSQAVRALAAHYKRQLAPGALRQIRSELRADATAEIKRFRKNKATRIVARTLRRACRTLDDLKVDGRGWTALRPGLQSIYRKGRRACASVQTDPSPENFHAWRKCAKDLWYQVRVLQPMWPEQMEATAVELGTLGDLLGDDHDLFVLQQDVAARELRDERERETLNGLVAQRQRELRAAALGLGTRFYAEKSAAFCDRLSGYWRTWRRTGEERRLVRASS